METPTTELKNFEFISNPEKGKVVCFACENELVGTVKECALCSGRIFFDGAECRCTKWHCRCRKEFIYDVRCPLCESEFSGSHFLASVIEDRKDLFIANMITHYRHAHRKWDDQWKYITAHCSPETYDQTKIKVNNQIKRALLRNKKFFEFLKSNGITKESFLRLQDNDEKTLELIEKKKF